MNLYETGVPSSEDFFIKEIDEKILIHRKDPGVKWNNHNKYFRSSVWDKKTGELISAGFRAFVNLGEQPEFESLDEHDDLEFVRKMDGSLLVVSCNRGELIVRTRGTLDATQMANGHEIEFLKKKYPKAFDNMWLSSEKFSILFEWTTPSNRIVLNESDEPALWLIGIVGHHTDACMSPSEPYHYFSQSELDQQERHLEVPRPERYTLNLKNVAEYLKDKDTIEGVVVYANNGQILKKVKTPRYLYLHRVFTGIKSVDHLFDLWTAHDAPDRVVFEHQLSTEYDWELVNSLRHLMDEMFMKWKQIQTQLSWMKTYLSNPEFLMLDRKERAQIILKMFPDHSGFAFALMDQKSIAPQKLWTGNFL